MPLIKFPPLSLDLQSLVTRLTYSAIIITIIIIIIIIITIIFIIILIIITIRTINNLYIRAD